MTIYEGYEVLEETPNAAASREHAWLRAVARLDAGTGAVAQVDRAEIARLAPRGFSWLAEGRPAITALRAWLSDRRGRQWPFWVATRRHDLVMTQDLGAGLTVLVAERTGYTRFQFADFSRRHLAFFLPGGAVHYRKVTAAAINGATEELTLASGIAGGVPAETLVSFLLLCRLAADEQELLWHSSELVELVMDFLELPREAPE